MGTVRYRLYVDESGDHNFSVVDDVGHRYLGLLGVGIETDYYRSEFHPNLEALKQGHFPHSPDDPVLLHREDIYNKRRCFGILQDPFKNLSWEQDFAKFVRTSDFFLIGVVIDKKSHKERYGNAADHPYHLCLTFLLERYKGFLNYYGHKGDVLAESRGRTEDTRLARRYSHIWHHGTYYNAAASFQAALTSRELKFRKKDANIAGLQFADLLAHPVKMDILSRRGKIAWGPCYGKQLADIFQKKYNKYGQVLFE